MYRMLRKSRYYRKSLSSAEQPKTSTIGTVDSPLKPQEASELNESSYNYAPQVLEFAKKEKISKESLDQMIRRAARVTSDLGNRRFHQYVFLQEGDDILRMGLLPVAIDCNHPKDRPLQRNEFVVFEECLTCGQQVKMIRKNPDQQAFMEELNARRTGFTGPT